MKMETESSCQQKNGQLQEFKKEFRKSRFHDNNKKSNMNSNILSNFSPSNSIDSTKTKTLDCARNERLNLTSSLNIRWKQTRTMKKSKRNVIWEQRCGVVIILTALCLLLLVLVNLFEVGDRKSVCEALRITNFRVPAYVPITLPTTSNMAQSSSTIMNHNNYHPLDLTKPILFDCDYDYKPDEDLRLTVRWFRNKESEPFYQWLPELNVRHLADWIKPLVNQSFVSDPLDPMKRYRSLLIKRLSMNLTGHYACVVQSLASQDTRQASLVVYQPPTSFTFKQSIYPAPAPMPPLMRNHHQHHPLFMDNTRQQQFNQFPASTLQKNPNSGSYATGTGTGSAMETHDQSSVIRSGFSPTQFKGFSAPLQTNSSPASSHLPISGIIRPPNNNNQTLVSNQAPSMFSQQRDSQNASQPLPLNTKIVYTHDGRPIRRKQSKRQTGQEISNWMLRKRLGQEMSPASGADQLPLALQTPPKFAIQLHHFQCQATQVTPRPVILLSVKRDLDSIAQYLHESTTTSVRPYQVNHADYFESSSGHLSSNQTLGKLATTGNNETGDDNNLGPKQQLLVTLYDITVSATVALNVSLSSTTSLLPSQQQPLPVPSSSADLLQVTNEQPTGAAAAAAAGINTVLSYRRGQRMLFECQLEITGTEFEQRKRIYINEEEVYQFAEAEERKRKLRVQQRQQQVQNQAAGGGNNRMLTAEQDADSRVQDLDDQEASSRFRASASNSAAVHLNLDRFSGAMVIVIFTYLFRNLFLYTTSYSQDRRLTLSN